MQDIPLDDAATKPAYAFGPFGHGLLRASKALAIAGGLVFVLLVAMSIVSIVGRKLFSAPVPGDMEVLQMAAAFASACFFAHCHLQGGDVKVDFFTAYARPVTVCRLDAMGSLLVGIFGALITWRSCMGALSIKAAGETSMILGWPVWIAQMLMVPGFFLLALAGFYKAWVYWQHGLDASAAWGAA